MKVDLPKLTSLQKQLISALLLTIPFLVYTSVLAVGLPEDLLRIPFASLIVFVLTCGVLYLAFRLPGRVGTVVSLSLTLVLFGIFLLGSWINGLAGYSFSNLLPWNDPNMYFTDARRLLEGIPFTYGSQRRPIFAGVFATVLGIAHQNLQVTLILLTLIVAIASFLAARQVQRSYGTPAAVIFLVLLVLFHQFHVGRVLTEVLGLALGAVGFALLLNGARRGVMLPCILGIIALSLGLNVRAGAFFVLPFLVIWGAWSFRRSNKWLSWQFLLAGSAAVLSGFFINSIVSNVINTPGTVSFGNFSYVLYGLIAGGDWRQVFVDYPELKTTGVSDQQMYDLAFAALQKNPFGLVKGCFRAWGIFLFSDYSFSFILYPLTNLILRILAVFGLVACALKRRDLSYSLIIAACVGTFFSIPFIPPWDSPALRVYAATIPFIAILPAIGFVFLVEKIRSTPLIRRPESSASTQALQLFGIGLILFCFLGPLATRWVNQPSQSVAHLSCPAGTEFAYFYYDPGASVDVVRDDSGLKTRLPIVVEREFHEGLTSLIGSGAQEFHGLPGSLLSRALIRVPASMTVINTLNLKTLNQMLLVARDNQLPDQAGLLGACGHPSARKKLIRPDFMLFYADSIYPEKELYTMTAGATSTEPGWHPSHLIDNTEETWGSAGLDEDTIFYVTLDRGYAAKFFDLTLFGTPAGLHMRDVSVVATSDPIDENPKWTIIKSRVNPEKPFRNKSVIPNLPDRAEIRIEIDTQDPRWKEYKTWGLACFSKSKGYRRNYLSPSGEGGGVYVREMELR